MTDTVTDRFTALDEAFRDRAPRSERLNARFAALTCVAADDSVAPLVERSFNYRASLNEGLGPWRSPSKAMRLVFGAALAMSGRTPQHFFRTRRALAARRAERGARALSHGGSCAALSLVTAGGDEHLADAFFDLREAVTAPWWRRDAAREEVLAAALAAMGETPEEARTRLDNALTALDAAGVPSRHAQSAAREICLSDFDPDALAKAWATLNAALRDRRALRHGVGQPGLAVLAASGDGQALAEALVENFEAVRALRPRSDGSTAASIAMRLAQIQAGTTSATSAAGDLAAILAAQAALVATLTATTAATVMVTN